MRKIYHVVMSEVTVTFLSYGDVQTFLGKKELVDRLVVCESEISDDHFAMMADWHHELQEEDSSGRANS